MIGLEVAEEAIHAYVLAGRRSPTRVGNAQQERRRAPTTLHVLHSIDQALAEAMDWAP